MRAFAVFLWAVACALIILPLLYGFRHWSDAAFRDAAVAGWLGTALGAIVGVPFALQLARFQESNQARTAAAHSSRQFAQEARVIRERLYEEIQFNVAALEQLQAVVANQRSARADVWIWASCIAESFEFSARRDYERIAFRTVATRLEDEPFFSAYRSLNRLRHAVKQASAAHSFFLGSSADQRRADELLAQIAADGPIVNGQLTRASQKLKEWIR